MKNLLSDILFPSFLTSGEVEGIDNDLLLKEIYDLKAADDGITRSNKNGWHSQVYYDNAPAENLNKLLTEVGRFGNTVLEYHQLGNKVTGIDWWINVNPQYSYNVLHAHPKSDLSVVYYPAVDEQSSKLSFIRNDAALCTNVFYNRPEFYEYMIQPVVGRMYAFPSYLLHYVQSNMQEQDRVSIAFNLNVSRGK